MSINSGDSEIPKYRKRKPKHKTARSDHKHEYEQVLVNDRFSRLGTICTICGKLNATLCIFTKSGTHRIMCDNIEDAKSMYPGLRVLEPSEISELERKRNFLGG